MVYSINFHEKNVPLIIGMHMTGFGLRLKPSDGTHDNPMIKCLSVYDKDASDKKLFIHMDLLGYSAKRCDMARKEIFEKTGVKPENVFITCTHTHSGPASITLLGCGDERDDWYALEHKAIVDAAVECVNGEHFPVSPSLYKGYLDTISYNRVVSRGKPDPSNIDTDVFSIVMRDPDSGKIRLVISNFACHPVTAREQSYKYSRDYPYFTERTIKEKYGEDTAFIFANGCCGDINPVYEQQTGFESAEKEGRILGEKIVESIESGKPQDVSFGEIKIIDHNIKFPIEKRDSDEELEKFRATTMTLKQNAKLEGLCEFYDCYLEWIDRMKAEKASGVPCDFHNAHVVHVSFGDVNIVLTPFETFHEIGKNIKKLLGEDRTMVFELSGGNFGYMASYNYFPKSSYEVNYAHLGYCHHGPVCRESENMILDALKSEKK